MTAIALMGGGGVIIIRDSIAILFEMIEPECRSIL